MNRLLKSLRKEGAGVLLAASLLLGGTKSPAWFCLWALAALGWAMIVVETRPPSRRALAFFIAFVAGILLAQLYSLDRTASLFWTTQLLVFACLWLAFETAPSLTESFSFWPILLALGVLTALVTAFQWIKRDPAWGLLPINPNFNAVWMASLAAALLSKTRSRAAEKSLCLGLSVLVVLGQSRSGLLALLVGVCYAATLKKKGGRLIGGLALSGILALLIPHAWLFNRLNLFENGARLRIWTVALQALTEHPLTGYGPGNFELAYLRYAFPVEGAVRYARTTAFAHNDYLQALSEWGWPTAGFLMIGFASLLLRPADGKTLGVPAKAALVALATAAFFNSVFKMPFLVLWAIVLAASLRETPEPRTPAKVTTGLLILFMTFVGFLTLWCGTRAWWAMHGQWEQILRYDPHDAEAWHELAPLTKNADDALLCHRKAVEQSPFNLYDVEALARTLESFPGKDHVAEALQTYFRANRLAPTRAVNDLGIARLLLRSGEPAHALAWAEIAMAVEPNYWEAYFWKARALRALGKRKEAAFVIDNLKNRHEVFERSAPTPPQSPYEEAILHYEEAAVRHEGVQ